MALCFGCITCIFYSGTNCTGSFRMQKSSTKSPRSAGEMILLNVERRELYVKNLKTRSSWYKTPRMRTFRLVIKVIFAVAL
jgi:hypothetical protein